MSQLMKGCYQGLPNAIQAPGGSFSLRFVGGSAAVDAALLAASMSHLHKPIVGDISFDGGVAKCKAVRSHTGDLSLGADAFANFKTEFERYTVIFS